MSQQNTEMNQTVDNLARQAESRFGGGSDGMAILTGIVVLSGVLSAIFFWENSAQVFTRVWPPAAIALGLLVGLLPSEGAFFGWKRIRAAKADMTTKQMQMTAWGIGSAVFFSIFSTFALFVSSFSTVPDSIKQYAPWFTFIALAVPLLVQFALFAVFVVNEMSVIQNHERTKVGAMRFASLMRFERARVMATLLGMEAELNRQLTDYGAEVGTQNAEYFLGNRPRTVTDQPDHQLPAPVTVDTLAAPARPGLIDRVLGRKPTAEPTRGALSDHPHLAALGVSKLSDDDVARIAAAMAALGNSTHDAPRHDPTVIPLTEQPAAGQGNGPAGHRIGEDTRPL